MKILFVCRGNVGRSQMAEMIFNQRTTDLHSATSAGTDVLKKDREGELLKNNPSATAVLTVLTELSLDASDNVRKQFNSEMARNADVVVFLIDEEIDLSEDIVGNRNAQRWPIEDPYNKSLERTREIRDEIASRVSNLLTTLGS